MTGLEYVSVRSFEASLCMCPFNTALRNVQGDTSCSCIAAASIIAKVTRDRLMLRYDE